jgi:uroporphyrinogen-III synthase
VGPATAAALRRDGIQVEVVGSGGGRELAAAWGPRPGERLLLPQAREAHPALRDGLLAAGAEPVCIPVYESVPVGSPDRDALKRADVICFFAPSAVRAFHALGLETGARVWAHGPTTRAVIEELLLEGDFDAVDDLL